MQELFQLLMTKMEELHGEIVAVRKEAADMHKEVKKEVKDMHEEVKKEVADMHGELMTVQKEVKGLRADVDSLNSHVGWLYEKVLRGELERRMGTDYARFLTNTSCCSITPT